MKHHLCAGAALLLTWNIPAQAQDAAAAASPVEGVARCAAIADDGDRLRCFDRSVASMEAAIRDKRLVVLDAPSVRQKNKALFGFSTPNVAALGLKQPATRVPDAPRFVDSTVSGVRQVAYATYAITLANGAVWRNVDPLDSPPEGGAKVHIDHSPVGGYLLKVPGSPSVHARRLR